jgi:hypothetical protein
MSNQRFIQDLALATNIIRYERDCRTKRLKLLQKSTVKEKEIITEVCSFLFAVLPQLCLPPLKEIMRNDPLFTIIQSPKLGTSKKEETPINVPLPLLALTIGFLQDWCQRSILPVLVQIVQPPIRRLFIVGTIDTPVLFDTKVTSKVQQQVITGHGTTGKEVIRHPTLFKMIGVILVGKNVHEQLSRWFQKAVDQVHQVIVILHVFKHFDRHDAVIVLDDTQCALVVRDVAL